MIMKLSLDVFNSFLEMIKNDLDIFAGLALFDFASCWDCIKGIFEYLTNWILLSLEVERL